MATGEEGKRQEGPRVEDEGVAGREEGDDSARSIEAWQLAVGRLMGCRVDGVGLDGSGFNDSGFASSYEEDEEKDVPHLARKFAMLVLLR